jgi:hypothetical protein
MRLKIYRNNRFGMEAGIRHVTGGQEAADWISYCLRQRDRAWQEKDGGYGWTRTTDLSIMSAAL